MHVFCFNRKAINPLKAYKITISSSSINFVVGVGYYISKSFVTNVCLCNAVLRCMQESLFAYKIGPPLEYSKFTHIYTYYIGRHNKETCNFKMLCIFQQKYIDILLYVTLRTIYFHHLYCHW